MLGPTASAQSACLRAHGVASCETGHDRANADSRARAGIARAKDAARSNPACETSRVNNGKPHRPPVLSRSNARQPPPRHGEKVVDVCAHPLDDPLDVRRSSPLHRLQPEVGQQPPARIADMAGNRGGGLLVKPCAHSACNNVLERGIAPTLASTLRERAKRACRAEGDPAAAGLLVWSSVRASFCLTGGRNRPPVKPHTAGLNWQGHPSRTPAMQARLASECRACYIGAGCAS